MGSVRGVTLLEGRRHEGQVGGGGILANLESRIELIEKVRGSCRGGGGTEGCG